MERLLSGYFILELIVILGLTIAGIIYFIINPIKEELFNILVLYFSLISEIFSMTLFSVLYGLNYVGKSNTVNLFRTVFRLIFILALYPILGITGALLALLITPFYLVFMHSIILKKI